MTCASSPGSTCTASNSSTPSARRWPLNGTSRNGAPPAPPTSDPSSGGPCRKAAAALDSESTTATRANCGPWPPSLDAASSSSRACRSCSHAVARAATKTRAHVRQTAARDLFTSEREMASPRNAFTTASTSRRSSPARRRRARSSASTKAPATASTWSSLSGSAPGAANPTRTTPNPSSRPPSGTTTPAGVPSS